MNKLKIKSADIANRRYERNENGNGDKIHIRTDTLKRENAYLILNTEFDGCCKLSKMLASMCSVWLKLVCTKITLITDADLST